MGAAAAVSPRAGPEAMALLQLEALTRRFGGVEAVSNIGLEVPAGRITGVIGPNGAGKTTLVNLITGMLLPSEGRITFDGRDISRLEPAAIARLGVARTFQTIRLLGDASALDNVVAGFHRHQRSSTLANLLGLPAARRELAGFRGRARSLLARFGVAAYADVPAGELSYGHQRRVEMARALALEPRLLLLDEPVAGMNDVEALALGEVFRSLAADGMGVLLIEHNMRFVMALCGWIHVMDSGRLIASGTPAQIASHPDVIRAYLGADVPALEPEADLA